MEFISIFGKMIKKKYFIISNKNKSLSETARYKDEELDEIKIQNNELKDDICKVKGIISKY